MIFDKLAEIVGDVAKEFITDKDKLNEYKDKVKQRSHEIKLAEIDLVKSQIEVNKEEAKSKYIPWRIVMGYVFAAVIAVNYIVIPLAHNIYLMLGKPPIEFFYIPDQMIWGAITGMLGLHGANAAVGATKIIKGKK